MNNIKRRILNRWNGLKITRKMILTNIVFGLLPMIIIASLFFENIINIVQENRDKQNHITFQQMENNIKSEILGYINRLNSIIGDSNLMDYLEIRHFDNDIIKQFNDYNYVNNGFINKYFTLEKDTLSTIIYSTNDTIWGNQKNLIIFSANQEGLPPWVKNCIENSSKVFIETVKGEKYIDKDGLGVSKVIRSRLDIEYINVLQIIFNENKLYSFIERESENKEIYLLDSNGYIVLTSLGESQRGRAIVDEPELIESISIVDTNKNNTAFNKKGDIVMVSEWEDTNLNGWKFIVVYPKESLSVPLYGAVGKTVLFAIIIIIISLIATRLFIRMIKVRLEELVINMEQIEKGNRDVYIVDESKDEIGTLTRAFSRMMNEINILFTKVNVADVEIKNLKIKNREAQLYALQSQINPHFLFNMLQSISMHLVKKGDYETSDVITKFSKLFRMSIDWKEDTTTIEKEIYFNSNYLELQKFRYKERFTYRVSLQPGISQNNIPKFIIQPIVENAFVYGVEALIKEAFIYVVAEREEDRIVIFVTNNGPGIDKDQVNYLNLKLSNSELIETTRKSLGLSNVNQRIKMYFGSEFGLEIASIKDVITQVTIYLPFKEANDV